MDAATSERAITCLLDQIDDLKTAVSSFEGASKPPVTDNLFTGVVPALISPFNEGGGVNVDVVPKLVDFLIGSGCSGFYICGNTGEGFAMTKEERIEMAEATMKAVAGRVPVCVHVGACPLAEAQELCKHAKSIGAAAVSSVVPTDKPNDLAAAVEYFVGVGEAAEIPFYVYWVGQNIDSAVDATQFLEAMKVVPNFKGLKFTDTNFYTFQQLHYQSKAIVGFKLNCVTGPDEMALAGLIMGSDGAIGSTYNIQPKINADMHAAFKNGDVATAMLLQERANVFINFLIQNAAKYSIPILTAIIGQLKACYRIRGFPVGRAKDEAENPIPPALEADLKAFMDSQAWAVE